MLRDLSWQKIIKWANILNKPFSTVEDIDDAVSKKHTQNSDTKLADSTIDEVEAEEIRNHIDNSVIHREILYDLDYKTYLIKS